MAPVDRAAAQLGTLRGSHTTAGLRMALAKLHHRDANLTDSDGKLSAAKIVERSPSMEQALTLGPSYLIVPSWFLEQFPGLSGLIQSTKNVARNVSVADHDMQMLARVGHRLDSGHPFKKVAASLVKNKTKNIESLAGMFEFARKHGVGDGMPLLSQPQAVIRSSGNSGRPVGPDFWDALQMGFKGPFSGNACEAW